jgi:MFS family permease
MHCDDIRKEGDDDRQARDLDLVHELPLTIDDDAKEGDDDRQEGQLDLISNTDTTHRGAADDTTTRRLLLPLRRRPVRRLLMGNLVSKTGDWLTVGALMGWIFQQTGSTGSVALLMLVRLAPPILGGGAAAALVDGVRKDRLLVWVELLRAVALGAVLAGMLAGVMPVVYVAIACSGLLGAMSPVAVSALIPSLVPEGELPATNGLAGVIESTAMAVGALAGGVLLALVGIGPALAADLFTFVLAALLFAGIGAAPGTDAVVAEQGADGGAAGPRLRDLLADRAIVTAVGALCITVAGVGVVNATLPRYLADLGLGDGAYGFGFGAIAIGLALGGAIAGSIRVENAGTHVLGRTLLATAVLFCALAAVANAPLALLLLVLIGVLDAIGWVMFDTVMQRSADPRLLGKAFGITDAVVRVAMIGSIALAPVANQLADPDGILLIGAAVLCVAGMVALGRYTFATGWRPAAG